MTKTDKEIVVVLCLIFSFVSMLFGMADGFVSIGHKTKDGCFKNSVITRYNPMYRVGCFLTEEIKDAK